MKSELIVGDLNLMLQPNQIEFSNSDIDFRGPETSVPGLGRVYLFGSSERLAYQTHEPGLFVFPGGFERGSAWFFNDQGYFDLMVVIEGGSIPPNLICNLRIPEVPVLESTFSYDEDELEDSDHRFKAITDQWKIESDPGKILFSEFNVPFWSRWRFDIYQSHD